MSTTASCAPAPADQPVIRSHGRTQTPKHQRKLLQSLVDYFADDHQFVAHVQARLVHPVLQSLTARMYPYLLCAGILMLLTIMLNLLCCCVVIMQGCRRR